MSRVQLAAKKKGKYQYLYDSYPIVNESADRPSVIVWISGPTGAGKSSLARVFRSIGYAIVQENLPKERFRAFAKDPLEHCELLQEEIMRSRSEGWRDVSSAPTVIFDRSIDEDVNVFSRMHHEFGLLSDEQYSRLQEVARGLQSAMPAPDLILLMWPERSVLGERVMKAEHPSVIWQHLDRQLSLYSEWVATRREGVLRLDNSRCELEMVEKLFLGRASC